MIVFRVSFSIIPYIDLSDRNERFPRLNVLHEQADGMLGVVVAQQRKEAQTEKTDQLPLNESPSSRQLDRAIGSAGPSCRRSAAVVRKQPVVFGQSNNSNNNRKNISTMNCLVESQTQVAFATFHRLGDTTE
jgi:hypothetical protein